MRRYYSFYVLEHDKHVFFIRFCHSGLLRWRRPSPLPHARFLFGFRVEMIKPGLIHGDYTAHVSPFASIVIKSRWMPKPAFHFHPGTAVWAPIVHKPFESQDFL